MPVFDTSALVPLFIDNHPRHREAKDAFEGAETVVLHPSVITELTIVVRRFAKDAGEDGNAAARRALTALLDQPRVAVRADMDHEAAVRLYLSDSGLSFTDAVVACSVRHFDKQGPVAFDDRIRQARAPS